MICMYIFALNSFNRDILGSTRDHASYAPPVRINYRAHSYQESSYKTSRRKAVAQTVAAVKTTTIPNTDPHIFYHGRWDASPGTWWTGSGFKIRAQGLTSLTLNLGNHTTSPVAAAGITVNDGTILNVNVSQGANPIPLNLTGFSQSSDIVVGVNMQGWQNNRMNLLSIDINAEAKLLKYEPSELAFQFIGDSLSAGQFLPEGVDQAWPWLVSEYFKAERRINAQPGITLTDMQSYGNVHGMTYQFWKTEDTGYYYTTDHNYTTPWNFARDIPSATHVIVFIGANDAGQSVPASTFETNYLSFLANLRKLYRYQPFFILSPWGWPNPTGPNNFYYNGTYQSVVDTRHSLGDEKVYLVNTTGWVDYADVFPANQHPTVEGHVKIAGLLEQWLLNWGVKPARENF